jgi:hypothetical protein
MNPDAIRIWFLMAAARVCMHPVHTAGILILFLLYSEIFLMHQLDHIVFPDVLSVSAGALTMYGHDTTMNVIGAQSATQQPFVVQVMRSPDKVNSPVNHHVNLIPQMH